MAGLTLTLLERSPSLRERGPGADEATARAGRAMLQRLVEHADAPRWTHSAGDRLQPDDVAWLDELRDQLRDERAPQPPGPPRPAVLLAVAEHIAHSPLLRQRVPHGTDLAADWAALPTMDRATLANELELLVPLDAPLDELLLYRTAGTTGHALRVPHHRRSVAALLPLIEVALQRWGVTLDIGPDRVVCALLGAQADTATYPTVLSGWGGGGFVKLNLHPGVWPSPGAAARYLADLNPRLITGDPITFAELLRQDPDISPQAFLSTAVAMSAPLRERLAARFGCPVVDWYSLTETGPIAARCPHAGRGEPEAFHVVPADLHVEVLDTDGAPVVDGERGEVTVSGGRNPFVPLVRYRTGDWGRLLREPCSCGDPGLRIADLEGRTPVLFRAASGGVVNPVDLARVFRRFPLVCHELEQREDGSLALQVRSLGDGDAQLEHRLRGDIAALMGPLPLEIQHNPTLGDRSGKAYPWRSAVRLEQLLGLVTDADAPDNASAATALSAPSSRHHDHPGPHRPHRVYVALTNHCNRACPWCSTASSPAGQTFLSPERFAAALPVSGQFEVQFEGGEPLVHPDFWQLWQHARAHPRSARLVLCTNGVTIPRQAPRLAAFLDRLGAPTTLKLSWNHHLRDRDPGLLALAQAIATEAADRPGLTFVLNVRLRPDHPEDHSVRAAVAEAGLSDVANVFELQAYGLAADREGWQPPHTVWGDFQLINPDGATFGTDLLARSAAMAALS